MARTRLFSLQYATVTWRRRAWRHQPSGYPVRRGWPSRDAAGWCVLCLTSFRSASAPPLILLELRPWTAVHTVLQKKTTKKRSERRKRCALAVVRRSQKKFRPATDPLPGGAGRPKFKQLEMVTTFTYKPTDKQAQPQTHKQTGPITTHCAAKLSAQCNSLHLRVLVYIRRTAFTESGTVVSDLYSTLFVINDSSSKAIKHIPIYVGQLKWSQLTFLFV